jgi:hypothetical protein
MYSVLYRPPYLLNELVYLVASEGLHCQAWLLFLVVVLLTPPHAIDALQLVSSEPSPRDLKQGSGTKGIVA